MKSLPLLFCTSGVLDLLSRVKAEVEVNFANGESFGPFDSPKYSNLIGNFDSSCSFQIRVTSLQVGEDPCEVSSFERSIDGEALVLSFVEDNINCFEETAFANLESLGVLAVLNADPEPPGSTINRWNFGKKLRTGETPLLDLGLDFFSTVIPRLNSGEEAEVTINGCSDTNNFFRCYNVNQTILSFTLLIPSLYGFGLVNRALKSIYRSAGTAPRIFILKISKIAMICFGISGVSGLSTVDGFFWPSGGVFYSGVHLIVHGLLLSISLYITLLTAYYWFYLQERCFEQNRVLGEGSMRNLVIQNSRKDFFARIELKIIHIIVLLSIVVNLYLLLQLHPDFILLEKVFNFVDIGLMTLLVAAMYGFIARANKVILLTTSFLTEPVGLRTRATRFISLITGRTLRLHFLKSSGLPEDPYLSRSTMRLTLHLSKWIQIYVLLILLETIVAEVVLDQLDIRGRKDSDEFLDSCAFIFPPHLLLILKVTLLLPIIQGIKGPPTSSNKKTSARHLQTAQAPHNTSGKSLQSQTQPSKQSLIAPPRNGTGRSKLRAVTIGDDFSV